MKTKKVTRHYCDHCGKGMFGSHRMFKHEARCCRNLNRACGVCQQGKTDVAANAKFLIEHSLAELEVEVGGCPACILAAHMQANVITEVHEWQPMDADDNSRPRFYYYDYKEAMEKWFADQRDAEREAQEFATY